MAWRDFISGVYTLRTLEPAFVTKPIFQPRASVEQIDAMESQLHLELTADLRTLLIETNGVMELMKIDDRDWFENIWLVWPIERIVADNLVYRRDSSQGIYDGPFEDLLVFSSAGTDGILFAHPIVHGSATPSVFAWFPGEVKLKKIAPGLEEFLEGWLMDRIVF